MSIAVIAGIPKEIDAFGLNEAIVGNEIDISLLHACLRVDHAHGGWVLAVGMEALDGIDLTAMTAGALHIIVIRAIKLRQNWGCLKFYI